MRNYVTQKCDSTIQRVVIKVNISTFEMLTKRWLGTYICLRCGIRTQVVNDNDGKIRACQFCGLNDFPINEVRFEIRHML